jgi:hypothetical protein
MIDIIRLIVRLCKSEGKDESRVCQFHDEGHYVINGERRCCKCIVNQIMLDIQKGDTEALSQYFGE